MSCNLSSPFISVKKEEDQLRSEILDLENRYLEVMSRKKLYCSCGAVAEIEEIDYIQVYLHTEEPFPHWKENIAAWSCNRCGTNNHIKEESVRKVKGLFRTIVKVFPR